ncbi:MAG: bifunctional phosphopantothenoylcysteine decarboxylase/phosphopantothenate--cysteine ligase CoaBC [Crocinitomicaceae bacterium]|nr:bifunctional phosphopantothenoylcysteine decarboxylase/phosphopantothenate--cysteine ligase CoaBC [Crocinitomicaceae bacterium]
MKGKRILLGITGGIAAYKIAFLIRLLKKEEAEVRCIMTPASCDFISPLTIATLSENPVHIDFWNQKNGEWTNHVDLGMWPDIFLIAPLTANTLAKLTHGYCDNLLTATYLSAKCQVIVAPAMDLDMYSHPTTVSNIKLLEDYGVKIIPAEEGELASGLVGKGRLAEPETIVEVLKEYFQKKNNFLGKKVLITAGPTYEHIDPVRFIGNHSSGKMGYDIARSFLDQGAEVVLVSGPTKEILYHPKLNLISIVSADDMLLNVQQNWDACTIGVFCAAVADYKPVVVSNQKIKKSEETLTIELVKNPDILAWAGEHKSTDQFLVGFALETQNARQYALNKKDKKNLDAIVLNTLEDEGAGFGLSTNKIEIITPSNDFLSFPLKNKSEVANDIVSFIYDNLN